VAARSVRLTSPERVLFPDEGITKQDLFEYYRAIAPVLVPHLRNRPFTMKRSPYGVAGDAYFQKQAPKGMPSWIPTRTFRTYPREGGSRLVDFPLVNSPEAVLWMVQMNCIDMNAWYSRVDKPHRPDFVLFDLDPPDGGFALAIRVAHLIREELERLELESYVKTSGADGIHVLVPIARRATFEQTYAFAERVARGLEERRPGLVTTEWLKRKREGVLVDHRQNARGKTIASVYSVRPKPGAPVSTPLRWDELKEDVTPRRFGMREALERVEQHGDLFEPVLAGGQALGRRSGACASGDHTRTRSAPGVRTLSARRALPDDGYPSSQAERPRCAMERAGIEPVTSGWQIQVGAALQRVSADAQLDRWDARAADTALTLRASAAHDHVKRPVSLQVEVSAR
jgi:bifunctional non-homologous end joining protein LigD